MKLRFSGLTGPVLNAFNNLNDYLERLRSVPLRQVATLADLPNADAWDCRQIIVLDVGGATMGVVTASAGVWKNYLGVTVA